MRPLRMRCTSPKRCERYRYAIAVVALLVQAFGQVALAESVPPPAQTAQQRYESARRLMQQGKFDEAATRFRAVADDAEVPSALQAQALVAAGLMQENNRNYEQAAANYREVQQRFPGTEFARRAEAAVSALEVGGAQRGIEFRRRQDAVWDELFPAQAEAARGDWATARPKLERVIIRLGELLRDFRDHPKARDIAIALGNTQMLLENFRAARDAYADAIAIVEAKGAARGAGGPGMASLLLDAQERYNEAVKSWRRVWIERTAWTLLAILVVGLFMLRPWRAIDGATVSLGIRLCIATAVASALAAVGSYTVRTYVDPHSPIEDRTAALLVTLPGFAAIVLSLGFAASMRVVLGWSDKRVTLSAALLGALGALAVAALIINAFGLFPILDSEF